MNCAQREPLIKVICRVEPLMTINADYAIAYAHYRSIFTTYQF